MMVRVYGSKEIINIDAVAENSKLGRLERDSLNVRLCIGEESEKAIFIAFKEELIILFETLRDFF
jgi:hypothetical protein